MNITNGYYHWKKTKQNQFYKVLTWFNHDAKLINMKISYVVLILILSTLCYARADEVKKFEIEQITVGESLLNHMAKNQILNKLESNNTYFYPNKSFATFGFIPDTLELYDDVGVIIKPNDENYKIYALEGTIYFKEKSCEQKQIQISNDLKNYFEKDRYTFNKALNLNYIGDETGESKVNYFDFTFYDGSAVRVICWKLGKNFKSQGYINRLVVAVNSSLFMKFLNEKM
ncbi:hypothetical protein N9U50_01980 [Candidatus Pelagibacter sp.]|nr:hypothetical protein [Candidatus Pelagibacter sp.]